MKPSTHSGVYGRPPGGKTGLLVAARGLQGAVAGQAPDTFDEIVRREGLRGAHWGHGGIWGVDRRGRVTFVEAVQGGLVAVATPEWAKVRERVLRRDHRRCRHCQTGRALTVHHIVPRAEGGTDEPRNLVTLCAACHDWAEIERPSWDELARGRA